MSPVRVRLGPLRGSVAQSVEQGTENPRVAGSIPAGTTIRNSEPSQGWSVIDVASLVKLRALTM